MNEAFDKIDEVYFDFQFRDKLEEKKLRVNVELVDKLPPQPHLCGITLKGNTFHLQIPENINSKAALKHQMVHLAMILWDMLYTTEDGDISPIYEPHSSLFRCIYESYFEEFEDDELLEICTQPEPEATFEWEKNSCYLDSLMTVLFFGTPYIRDTFLYSDLENTSYPFPKSICSNKSIVETESRARKMAVAMQDQLKEDYERLVKNEESFVCGILRKLLLICLPEMKRKSRWVFFNPSAVYSVFVGLFPNLLFSVSNQVIKDGAIERRGIREASTFAVSEFMLNDPGTHREEIVWDKVNSPVLIFENTGIPIKYLGDTDTEEIVIGDEDDEDSQIIIFEKKRALQEVLHLGNYIYVLGGVIIAHGARGDDSEDANHYTCFFRTLNGRTYRYDDQGPTLEELDGFPAKIFRDTGGRRPMMYFYNRIF